MTDDLDYMYTAYYEAQEAERSDLYDDEPDCECRFSGDQADASDCELHNGNSPWNVSQRRIAAEIERFGETRRLTKEMDAWMDAYYERKPVGNEHVAEPFRAILHGIQVSTPCSCMEGDTRTCFLHGEVA